MMSAALAGAIGCAAPLALAAEPVRAPIGAVLVDGVDVEQVPALGAGVPLNFTVFGTPGALVALRIDGGRRVLELNEVQAGIYEGSYLIDRLDAIRPESRVTATLQKNGAVAYAALDEPLLLARGTVPWTIAGDGPALTPLPVPPAAAAAVPQPAPPAGCSDCAVVESVRAVDAAPRGGVIGAIGGAIAGAILGKEAGEAHNRRVLAVLGAIGGALAGRQIERQATQSTHYEVGLRLADGTRVKRHYEQQPPFTAGATIRLGTPWRGTSVPVL